MNSIDEQLQLEKAALEDLQQKLAAFDRFARTEILSADGDRSAGIGVRTGTSVGNGKSTAQSPRNRATTTSIPVTEQAVNGYTANHNARNMVPTPGSSQVSSLTNGASRYGTPIPWRDQAASARITSANGPSPSPAASNAAHARAPANSSTSPYPSAYPTNIDDTPRRPSVNGSQSAMTVNGRSGIITTTDSADANASTAEAMKMNRQNGRS